MRRRARLGIGALCAAAVVMTGCGYKDVYSLPLPGGVGGGSGSYKVVADFADAGNLVPRESCRANDVPIGTITSISVTPDLRARVVCQIEGSAHLPANTDATIETTSLLGEAYVALGPPAGAAPEGRLAAGAQIPDSGTHADPDVEEILGSLSAILNDGDIGDL
jgi:phospholipid/cholesterol/gamma-HCH transport system substrate-binding protein